MTVKDFARKYDIPYNIAFKSSYVVKGYGEMQDRNYSESDLYDETVRYVRKMTAKYTALLDMYKTAMKNLEEKT